jgi:hypothetical protein
MLANENRRQSERRQLHKTVARVSEQIGIKKPPKLFLNRMEYSKLRKRHGYSRRVGLSKYGECLREAKAIFVNTRMKWICVLEFNTKSRRWVRYHGKPRFEDFVRTVIHELVHYRWSSMRHGKHFEKRVDAVIGGERFL